MFRRFTKDRKEHPCCSIVNVMDGSGNIESLKVQLDAVEAAKTL